MVRVLIADDSKTSQMLVMRALHHITGIEFLSAENGLEALAVLESNQVDLLITDVNMPEMDGIALVREVRKKQNDRELPILIITAKGEASAKSDGMALGANAYVLKPLSGQELLEKAQSLLNHQRSHA
jgi:two-component system chemotaxis response regulator CheY